MTKGEVEAFESEAEVFSVRFDQANDDAATFQEKTEEVAAVEESKRDNLGLRFTRLKKSLRKRSVSIL